MSSEYTSLLSIEDLITSRRITSITKNNSYINDSIPSLAFVVNEFDISVKKGTNDIFIYNQQSNKCSRITRNEPGGGSSSPTIQVDKYPGVLEDTIAYLKDGQLWQIPLNGGEAWQITKVPIDIDFYRLFYGSDNQPWIVIALDVYPNLSINETKDKDNVIKSSGTSGVVYDKLMIRHWDNWGSYSKRRHIFIGALDITSEGLLTLDNNKLYDTMFGLESDCPGKGPGQSEEEFNISSDGKYLAVAKRRTNDDNSQKSDMAWSTDVPIYLAELSLHSSFPLDIIYKLISGEDWQAVNNCPVFTPDNNYLLFLSMSRPKYESDKTQIRLYNLSTDSLISLTEHIDLSFHCIEFGKCTTEYLTIYSVVLYHGVSRIFRLTVDITISTPIVTNIEILIGDNSRTSPLYVYNPISDDKSRIESLYYLECSLTKPNELKVYGLNQLSNQLFQKFIPKQITSEGMIDLDLNDSYIYVRDIYNPCPEYVNGDRLLSDPAQHYFIGSNNDTVHSWFLPPTTYTSSQLSDIKEQIPLVLIVHGGPQAAILNNWSYRWNMNIFAAQGYAVYTINYHGSISYGQSFTDSINSDWGGKPYEDHIIGLQYILKQYPYINPNRMAALGASYGGYMMNWLNGHTDMFKCLVNHDGIFSLKSQYYTTEELWFPEFDIGLPWENKEIYDKFSPDSYIDNWKTPTLVIHGGLDYRVCETEGISTFTVLQRKGIDSQLLYFPDENHWVLKRLNSKKWHETVFAWLRKYLLD